MKPATAAHAHKVGISQGALAAMTENLPNLVGLVSSSL